MATDELSFSDLLSMLRRRFVVFANTFIAFLSLSVLLAFGLPSVYESTATILIEQQDIPDDLVQSTITSRIQKAVAPTKASSEAVRRSEPLPQPRPVKLRATYKRKPKSARKLA